MRFAVLGSGSKGNCTLVQSSEASILIDCGFSYAETARRLSSLGVDPQSIDAVFLTHEHSDHSAGLLSVCRRLQIPLYASWGSCTRFDLDSLDVRYISGDEVLEVADLRVHVVTVPHDSREPTQFLVQHAGLKLGVLTDLGYISSHVANHYSDCDALLLECNHDPEMLADGPYPPKLKARVRGNWGHLSNGQAAELLRSIDRARLQHLVIAHISEKNNSINCVQEMLAEFGSEIPRPLFAEQGAHSDWITVTKAPVLAIAEP